MMKTIVLLLLNVQFSNSLTMEFQKSKATLAEELNKKLIMIQSTKDQKIHLVIPSPKITQTQMEEFTTKCKRSFNLTEINKSVPNMVIEALSSFVTHKTKIPKPTQNITTIKSNDPKYETVAEAVEKYFWGKDFTQKSRWEIVQPKNSRIKISKINDGSLKSGLSLREVCKAEEAHLIRTAAGEASGLAIIINNFKKRDLTNNDVIVITYTYIDQTGLKKIDCSDVLVSTEEYGSPVRPVTIFQTNCPTITGANITDRYFHIAMDVTQGSAVCQSQILEIQMYTNSILKFSQKRQQAALLAAAAGIGYIGSSIIDHFTNMGKQNDKVELRHTIDQVKLNAITDERKLLEIGENVGVQIDIISKTLDHMKQKMCLQDQQIELSTLNAIVTKIGNIFIEKVLLTINAISNNLMGNDGATTAIMLCEKFNQINKYNNNHKICSSYIYKNELKISSIQIQQNETEVEIIITLKTDMIRFSYIASKIYEVTSVPIPTRKLPNDLYEYISFKNIPDKYAILLDHNQTLAINNGLCEETDKILFCFQSLFDNLFSKSTACINAILGKNHINSCEPTRIISVSDCITKIKTDVVLISVSDNMEIHSHVRDLQIHRVKTGNSYKNGTYVLTRRQLAKPAYLSCEKTKVFVDISQATEATVHMKNYNLSQKVFLEEKHWIDVMNEIQTSSNEKIEKEMESLHPLNENLKKLLKTTKIQNEENEQKIEAPEFFDNEQMQQIDNHVRPYTVVIIIVLTSIILIMITTWLFCTKCPTCTKQKLKGNVRFILEKEDENSV